MFRLPELGRAAPTGSPKPARFHQRTPRFSRHRGGRFELVAKFRGPALGRRKIAIAPLKVVAWHGKLRAGY